MISIGDGAPEFALKDQFGRQIESKHFRKKRHVMLLFYPLDWTPT